MPRKEKKEKKEKATRKKISQKAIQTVVVNLDGATKRRRRGGRRKKTSRIPEPTPDYMPNAIIPPTVVYQTGYGDFRPPMNATIPVSIPHTGSTVSSSVGTSTLPIAFQDVGVGTEGLVNILDLPTKKETMDMLEEPVAKSAPPLPPAFLKVEESPTITENIQQIKPNFPTAAPSSETKDIRSFFNIKDVSQYTVLEPSPSPVQVKKPIVPKENTLKDVQTYLSKKENRNVTMAEALEWYTTPGNQPKFASAMSRARSKAIKSGEISTQRIRGGVRTIRVAADEPLVLQPPETVSTPAFSIVSQPR